MDHFDIYAYLVPFWQKRQELKSPEVKRVREAAAYYDQLVKHIKNK